MKINRKKSNLAMVWQAKQSLWDEVEKAAKGKSLSEKLYCLSIGPKKYLKEKRRKISPARVHSLSNRPC